MVSKTINLDAKVLCLGCTARWIYAGFIFYHFFLLMPFYQIIEEIAWSTSISLFQWLPGRAIVSTSQETVAIIIFSSNRETLRLN